MSQLFESLFAGEIRTFDTMGASRVMGDWARDIVSKEFGEQPEYLDHPAFLLALDRARDSLGGAQGHDRVAGCLTSLGIDLEGLFLDAVRLRAIPPGLENVEAAAPVFFAHRDTWYGNPKAQINGWLPLQAVTPKNSFRFYLDAFSQPVQNDSSLFVADDFEALGGFGRTANDDASVYPRALQECAGRTLDITLGQDELLLFSTAHLHQTLPNRTTKVRFSLDFRFVRNSDIESGRGAPDPDNRSRGSTVSSYRAYR